MQRGESHSHLRLDADDSDHREITCIGDGIVEERRLSDPDFAAQHECTGMAGSGRVDDVIDRRPLRIAAEEHEPTVPVNPSSSGGQVHRFNPDDYPSSGIRAVLSPLRLVTESKPTPRRRIMDSVRVTEFPARLRYRARLSCRPRRLDPRPDRGTGRAGVGCGSPGVEPRRRPAACAGGDASRPGRRTRHRSVRTPPPVGTRRKEPATAPGRSARSPTRSCCRRDTCGASKSTQRRRIARVQAGTLWLEVTEATSPFGLYPLSGSSPTLALSRTRSAAA